MIHDFFPKTASHAQRRAAAFSCFFALIALLMSLGAWAAEATKKDAIAVVCSATCSFPPMGKDDVEALWSGRRGADAFRGADPWDLPDAHPVQSIFVAKALLKDSAQYRAMWAKAVFNGKGRPPKVAHDEETLANELANSPNSIGYMSLSIAEKRGLKILAQY